MTGQNVIVTGNSWYYVDGRTLANQTYDYYVRAWWMPRVTWVPVLISRSPSTRWPGCGDYGERG